MDRQRSVDRLLQDIVDWTARLQNYVDGMDFEAFLNDRKTQDAAIRCLEVIGEASAQILKADPQLPNAYPGLQLRQAYRARNRTAHGYGSVSLETVWRSAIDAAPRMAAVARKVILERQQ